MDPDAPKVFANHVGLGGKLDTISPTVAPSFTTKTAGKNLPMEIACAPPQWAGQRQCRKSSLARKSVVLTVTGYPIVSSAKSRGRLWISNSKAAASLIQPGFSPPSSFPLHTGLYVDGQVLPQQDDVLKDLAKDEPKDDAEEQGGPVNPIRVRVLTEHRQMVGSPPQLLPQRVGPWASRRVPRKLRPQAKHPRHDLFKVAHRYTYIYIYNILYINIHIIYIYIKNRI